MWHLYPTDIGKKLYEKLIEEENRQIAVGLAGFSQEEVRTLLDLMQKPEGPISRLIGKIMNKEAGSMKLVKAERTRLPFASWKSSTRPRLF